MLAAPPSGKLWVPSPSSATLESAASGDLQRFETQLEIKALNTSERTIEAYVAVFGSPTTGAGADRNNDIIVKGAFAQSIATKRQIPLIGHDLEALRIGRCVERFEDDYGLFTKTYVYETTAGNDLLETARQSLIESDPLGNSIGYKVMPGGFSNVFLGGMVYRILKLIDWVEYSFLATRNIAANPAARTLSVKALVPVVEGPVRATVNPEERAALVEQRKAYGLADDRGVDVELLSLGDRLQAAGAHAISDLLAMRQLGLETKSDQRMSPTVFTAVQDICTKLNSLLTMAGPEKGGDDDADETMSQKRAPDETGTPGGRGSDAFPYSRGTTQPSEGDPDPAEQAHNRGEVRTKAAPAEHGQPGGFDPAGMMHGDMESKVYSGPDDPKLPANVQKASPTARAQWVHVWNDAHKRALADGKSAKDAEASAFAQANGVLGGRESKAGGDGEDEETKGVSTLDPNGEPGHHEPDDDDFGGPDDGDDDARRMGRKAAPAESKLDGDDDMNSKGLNEGSAETGGFLADHERKDAPGFDFEREQLDLMALSIGVPIRS